MSGQVADQILASRSSSVRWLQISLGEKRSAIRLSSLVRVLDRAELFSVPLLPKEFKGVIYFNERAVPILSWKEFKIEIFLNPLVLVLENGNDWVGIEVESTGKVEEYQMGSRLREDGFWVELDSEKGIWGIDEEKLFKSLRESPI